MTKLPAAYRHVAHEQVDSTNKLALDAAREGDQGNLWITATEQTAGRGRRGRNWDSRTGNLYASLLLISPADISEIAQLPLVIATAVHRAICEVVPPMTRASISIKWPNDILWNDTKVCGILMESSVSTSQDRAVVIGIGINCRTHPDQTDGLAASNLSQTGYDIDPKILFGSLANQVAERLVTWDGGKGLAAIREDWVSRAKGIGQSIIVRLPGEELHGVFDQLDEQGGLVLQMSNGQRRVIYAGDVFWPQV